MSLLPINPSPHYSRKSGRTLETQKFNYDCQRKVTETTNPWLRIIERIHITNSQDSGVLKAILDKHRNVTVKFGQPSSLMIDYQQAEKLFHANIPNCLKYYCFFTCKDDTQEIANRDFVREPYLCKGPGSVVGLTLMPYYPLGSVYQYKWTPEEFPIFLNIIKQTIYSMIEMYRLADSYVHPDLHLDNVLMRKTQKSELVYGERRLPLHGFYAVIIDFEPRNTGTTSLIQAISKILNLATSILIPNYIIRNDTYTITTVDRTYPAIFDSIDRILNTYILTPIPPMPKWS